MFKSFQDNQNRSAKQRARQQARERKRGAQNALHPDLRNRLHKKSAPAPDLREKLLNSDLREHLNKKYACISQESLEIQAGLTIPPLRYTPKLIRHHDTSDTPEQRRSWSDEAIKRAAKSNPPEPDDHIKYNFIRLIYPDKVTEEDPKPIEWTRSISYDRNKESPARDLQINLNQPEYQTPTALLPRAIYKDINPHYDLDLQFFHQNPELRITDLLPEKTTEQHLAHIPKRYKNHPVITHPEASIRPKADVHPEASAQSKVSARPKAPIRQKTLTRQAPVEQPARSSPKPPKDYVAWATRRGFPLPAKKPVEVQLPRTVTKKKKASLYSTFH